MYVERFPLLMVEGTYSNISVQEVSSRNTRTTMQSELFTQTTMQSKMSISYITQNEDGFDAVKQTFPALTAGARKRHLSVGFPLDTLILQH